MNGKYTITKPEEIRTALSFPKNMPQSFLPDKVEAIGTAFFKGDKMPKGFTSINDKFVIGDEYPIYYVPDGIDSMTLAVGSDGVGYKFIPSAWTRIKYFE